MNKQNLSTLQNMYYERRADLANIADKEGFIYKRLDEEAEALESLSYFIESVYEIAYGDNALLNGYSSEEVLKTLRGYSDKALSYDQLRNCL